MIRSRHFFVFVLICHYIMMDNNDKMRGRGHNRKWTYFNPRTEAGVEAAVEAGAGHTHSLCCDCSTAAPGDGSLQHYFCAD